MLVSSAHTGFVVRDIEKSIGFYRDVLGLELTGRGENDGLEKHSRLLGFERVHLKSAGFDLGNGHTLELLEYAHPRGREEVNDRNDLGAAHLAFFVTDIDHLYEGLIGRRSFYRVFAVLTNWLDRRLVDGIVDLVGWFFRNIGSAVARLQTGQTQAYATAVALGSLLIILGFLLAS